MPDERTLDKRILDGRASVRRMLGSMIIIDTALGQMSILGDRTPVETMVVSIRRITGDCFDKSCPCQLTVGYRASSI